MVDREELTMAEVATGSLCCKALLLGLLLLGLLVVACGAGPGDDTAPGASEQAWITLEDPSHWGW